MKVAGTSGAQAPRRQSKQPCADSNPNPAKSPKSVARHLRFWLTVAVAATFDIVTKWLAWKHLGPPQQAGLPRIIIPGWFVLETSENFGAVFGMGQGYIWLFILMSIVAAGLMVWLLVTSAPNQRMFHVFLGLILGGTLGNLYDRVSFGFVRDFLHFSLKLDVFGGSRSVWPYIFNLADVFLVVGVAGAIVASLASGRGKAEGSK